LASGEFRRGWTTVLAAGSGVGLGVAGLFTYNAGLFVHDLGPAIGLDRTTFGSAFFGSTVAMAFALPFVGRSVDRYGPRRTAAFGSLSLALGFLALGTVVGSSAGYVLLMILIGLLASACSPVAYSRAVSGAFDRQRGLALGLTQVGIGIAAAIVPPFISVIIAEYGWRAGYLALAGIAGIGLLPALTMPMRDLAPNMVDDGASFRAVRRTPLFRVQLIAFVMMAFAFAGMLAHFVPMLREAGLSPQRAGALAGLIGMSVIVTRIVVGWLADRVQPAFLGAASCALCAGGCLALAVGGAELAPIGALALGTAMGAEADLVGIMTARHFGIAAYSRAYATQYAAFMLAAGVSPLWVGFVADRAGDYGPALYLCALLLLIPIGLFLFLAKLGELPRFR